MMIHYGRGGIASARIDGNFDGKGLESWLAWTVTSLGARSRYLLEKLC